MKFYRHGKDDEAMPCVELPDGTLIIDAVALLALTKALVKKGTVTVQDIKDELP